MAIFKTVTGTTPYIETDPIFSEWITTCWDLNGNGVYDTATEDKNSDTVCDTLDCIGPEGPQGPAGVNGADGVAGADGIN